jgi:pimeloyl-ACP methyl ester carboxylesterase
MIVEADVRKAAEAKAAAPASSAPAATGTPSKGGLRRVSFYSDGQKLAGVLYLPSGATGPVPGVVLLVGYTYLKEMVVAEMARSLARDGFAALIFDYRGFGESEGPKERLFPLEQVADAHAAVTFLGAQPEVDSAQIAAVGLSLGGSHAVAAAATDQRIRAAVAIESPADGERWLRSLRRYSEWLDFAQSVADDRTARTVSGQGRSVDSLEIVLPDPDSASFLAQVAQEFPQMRTNLSLASADALITYSPETMAQSLGERPLLVIHGDADRLVPVAEGERLWGSAPNSRLEIIKGMGHFDWVFPTHPTFKHIMATISTWLREEL